MFWTALLALSRSGALPLAKSSITDSIPAQPPTMLPAVPLAMRRNVALVASKFWLAKSLADGTDCVGVAAGVGGDGFQSTCSGGFQSTCSSLVVASAIGIFSDCFAFVIAALDGARSSYCLIAACRCRHLTLRHPRDLSGAKSLLILSLPGSRVECAVKFGRIERLLFRVITLRLIGHKSQDPARCTRISTYVRKHVLCGLELRNARRVSLHRL